MIDRENHKESISLQIPDTAFWTLILIIMIIGLTLRTYDLGSLPDGLYRDEAANGYDA